MDIEKIKSIIDRVFDNNEDVNPSTSGEVRDSIETALDCLDKGELRVAEPLGSSNWQVNQWLKKAVLLSFKINDMDVISGGPQSVNNDPANWWDKIPSKFSGWNKEEFKQAGFRAVPGSVVRHSAFIAPSVVLMPSFVNIGAYVDSGSMIDTWATVGSCAQIGKNVHISGGAGIGGLAVPFAAHGAGVATVRRRYCGPAGDGLLAERRDVCAMDARGRLRECGPGRERRVRC